MSGALRRASGVVSALAALAASVPTEAFACGAMYAHEIEVAPEQNIVLFHRDGVETYVFRPRFCGAARDFGLILPIPSTLVAAPALADNALFDQIEAYTRPQEIEICKRAGLGCGMAKTDSLGLASSDFGTGVDVVDRGRVGMFEYALLQAVSVQAFTDWLDHNGFPRDSSSTSAYEYYVNKQWYFVAFKVNADASPPPEGKKLCGVLGPLQVAFTSATPVVPARIASVNDSTNRPPLTWRVFVVAANQQRLASWSTFYSTPYFSKALRPGELADSPALAAAVRDGERLTGLTVRFPASQDLSDIELQDDPNPADFRAVNEVAIDCDGGCASGGLLPADASGGALLAALLAVLHRATRRRAPRG